VYNNATTLDRCLQCVAGAHLQPQHSHDAVLEEAHDHHGLLDRVAVLVTTWGGNHDTVLASARCSWLAHIAPERLFIFSDTEAEGVIAIPGTSGGGANAQKKYLPLMEMAWKRAAPDVEWFLLVDDDTFVVVDNLLAMLAGQDSTEAMWFGQECIWPHYTNWCGGGGGVFSRAMMATVQPSMTQTCDLWGSYAVERGGASLDKHDQVFAFCFQKHYSLPLTIRRDFFSQPPEHYRPKTANEWGTNEFLHLPERYAGLTQPVTFHYTKSEAFCPLEAKAQARIPIWSLT
jgi:hypothetical protein